MEHVEPMSLDTIIVRSSIVFGRFKMDKKILKIESETGETNNFKEYHIIV